MTLAGFSDTVRISSKRISVFVNDDREKILNEIADIFNSAIYIDRPMACSSLGLVRVGGFSILVKNKKCQNLGSPGLYNEHLLVDMLHKQDFPMTINFNCDGKKFTVEDVVNIVSVGRSTANGKKADIILHTIVGERIPLSIKKNNAEMWGSVDSYYAGHKAKNIIDSLIDNEKVVLEQCGHYFKIFPNIAIKATQKETEDIIFGSDIYNEGAIIMHTFTKEDFTVCELTNDINIRVSNIIESVEELPEKHEVFFLIRNDKTRNVKGLYPGIRTLAVAKKRINNQVIIEEVENTIEF